MKRASIFFTLISAAAISSWACHFNVNLLPSQGPLKETVVSGSGKDRILILPIEGFISSYSSEGFLGAGKQSAVARVKEQLDAASRDGRIKAVILKIDSPGGMVTACDIIYNELMRYKNVSGATIVAMQMSMATSGGYFVSAAADRIVAHPTTVTGSIGVIMVKLSAEGLMQKIGVRDDTVKAGASKDFLSPYKTMGPDERLIVQKVLDSMHSRFKEVALIARGDVRDQETAFDGRVFGAAEALQRNLIDEIGYMPDAVKAAKKLAGLDKATVIRLTGRETANINEYSAGGPSWSHGQPATSQINLVNIDLKGLIGAHSPAFLYYWTP